MPMRWPRQTVRKVLSARTPRSSGSPTRRRAWAGGGAARNVIRRRPRRQRPLAVDRLAHGVDDAAEPAFGGPDRAGRGGDDGAAAAPHAFQRRKRHRQRMGAGKADHLAGNAAAGAALDVEPRADRHGLDRPGHLDHQPAHADDAAVDFDAVDIGNLFGEGFHGARSGACRFAAGTPLTVPGAHTAGEKTRKGRKLALRLTGRGRTLTWCLPASLIIGSSSKGLRPTRIARPGRKGRVYRVG